MALAIEVTWGLDAIGFLLLWVSGLAGFAYLYFFRVAVAISVESGRLLWRAPLAGGSAPLESVRRMRPLFGALEVIEVSGGRGIWIGAARGFDEVGKALQDRIPGFTYEFDLQAKLMMLLPFPRWKLYGAPARSR